MKKIVAGAKTVDERTVAQRDGALSRYHSLLRFISGIVETVDKRDAGNADILTQLRLFLEEVYKGKRVL